MFSERHARSAASIALDVTDAPRISVIIPTYRRRDHLRTVLDQLATQTLCPTEVFVLDSSPPGEQLGIADLERYGTWLRYEVTGPDSGNVSRKRNHALQRASGDLVLFLDDDVVFDSSLLAEYVGAVTDMRADAIGGLVLLPGESPSRKPRGANVLRIDDPGAPNLQAYDGVCESYVVCTASFCARREALMTVGGFDEQLSRLEDVELGLRLARSGYRVMHHNGPLVHHLMAPASGARAEGRGIEWMLSSLFYFQFRHFPARRRPWLLAATLWQFCRPSRHWLTPGVILRRARGIVAAYREAEMRLESGPRLLTRRS